MPSHSRYCHGTLLEIIYSLPIDERIYGFSIHYKCLLRTSWICRTVRHIYMLVSLEISFNGEYGGANYPLEEGQNGLDWRTMIFEDFHSTMNGTTILEVGITEALIQKS